MAKKKPAAKKPEKKPASKPLKKAPPKAPPKVVKKPVSKTAKPPSTPKRSPAKTQRAPEPVKDASPVLEQLGFFRGEYHWELDRHIPAFDERIRLNVDHTNGFVAPEQAHAVELLLETATPLRPLAVRAAYENMLRWVEGYQKRHPNFRGKPINEKPFTKGCELKSVLVPAPVPSDAPHVPMFVLSLFWPDDNRPCEVRFASVKGEWLVLSCERT